MKDKTTSRAKKACSVPPEPVTRSSNQDICVRGLRNGTKVFFEPWVCLFNVIRSVFRK